MSILPEDKYVMEKYCDVAEKFIKILEYYAEAGKAERKYIDDCFFEKMNVTFGEYFKPQISAKSKLVKKKRK